MSAVVDHLANVPLFQGMTESARDAVAALAQEMHFEGGDTVTREGDEGDAFYVIVDGRLEVSRNGIPCASSARAISSARSRWSTGGPGRPPSRPLARSRRWSSAGPNSWSSWNATEPCASAS